MVSYGPLSRPLATIELQDYCLIEIYASSWRMPYTFKALNRCLSRKRIIVQANPCHRSSSFYFREVVPCCHLEIPNLLHLTLRAALEVSPTAVFIKYERPCWKRKICPPDWARRYSEAYALASYLCRLVSALHLTSSPPHSGFWGSGLFGVPYLSSRSLCPPPLCIFDYRWIVVG